jgi:hypothetical protein
MRITKTFLVIFLVLNIVSCDYFTFKSDDREAVARVNNTYLYKDDINKLIGSDVNSQDSTLIVNNYISNWVKQQLLLEKAQLNLEDKKFQFEDLVKKYREDLYINSYKEAVVSEYLETEITEADIQKFYEESGSDFKLNEELIKLKYIQIGNDVLNKKELIKLFKSKEKEDLEQLQSMEMELISSHLNDSIWVKYSDLISKVPILTNEDKSKLLKKNSFIEKEDSLNVYLVAIKDVLRRNEVAPKSYIEPTIKQMILHQRKLLFLRNIEETLIEDAKKKNQFEIY